VADPSPSSPSGVSVFLAFPDGSDAQVLQPLTMHPFDAFDVADDLAWSPAGDLLAYTEGTTLTMSSPRALHVTDVSGNDVVVSRPASASHSVVDRPTWAPDGSLLSYLASTGPNWELFVSLPDGPGGNRRISPPMAAGQSVWFTGAWLADASAVVFLAPTGGYLTSELVLADADGDEWMVLSGPMTPGGAVTQFELR
jgi:hypothetical protein